MEIIEVLSMRLFREKKERKREIERATMFVCNRAHVAENIFLRLSMCPSPLFGRERFRGISSKAILKTQI